MKRMKGSTVRFVLVALVLAAGAACAEASSESDLPPEPATVIPDAGSPDATPDARGDAGDAARPPLATCTDDGWCSSPLPDVHPWGLQPLRILALAADATGGAWATTSAWGLADGATTSHLLHWEEGTWKPKFGVGFTQSERFPFQLNAIASNGEGSFMAVGAGTDDGSRSVVLRIQGGSITVDYPANVSGLVGVTFTTNDEAWALDRDGRLYRSRTTDGGAPSWLLVPTPHPADPNNFVHGPTVIFPSSAIAGGVRLAGIVEGTFGESGFIPGFGYVDTRSALPDGGDAWSSSVVRTTIGVAAGVETSASGLWLAADDLNLGKHFLLGSQPSDAGAGDAGDAGGGDAAAIEGGLTWPKSSAPLSVAPTALWARSATDVWAVGQVGRVFHYDGTAWADAKLALNGAPATINGLFAIAGLPSGEIWAGGEDVALHRAPPKGP